MYYTWKYKSEIGIQFSNGQFLALKLGQAGRMMIGLSVVYKCTTRGHDIVNFYQSESKNFVEVFKLTLQCLTLRLQCQVHTFNHTSSRGGGVDGGVSCVRVSHWLDRAIHAQFSLDEPITLGCQLILQH